MLKKLTCGKRKKAQCAFLFYNHTLNMESRSFSAKGRTGTSHTTKRKTLGRTKRAELRYADQGQAEAFLCYFLFIFLSMSINNKDVEIKIIDKMPQYNKYLEIKKYTITEPMKAIKNSLSIPFKVIILN